MDTPFSSPNKPLTDIMRYDLGKTTKRFFTPLFNGYVAVYLSWRISPFDDMKICASHDLNLTNFQPIIKGV